MNEAHYHLVVNHFPIMGTIFGLGILIAGMVFKKNSLQITAYVLFCIAAIAGFLSMNTGEGAEDLVENLPSVGHTIIHEHEEIAEKFAVIVYALAGFSLLTMYLQAKKSSFAKMASYFTLLLALIAAFIGKGVGTTGGEIRHTEIRTTVNATSTNTTEQAPIREADED